MIKNCKNCGNYFDAKGYKIYCNIECRNAHFLKADYMCKMHGKLEEEDIYLRITGDKYLRKSCKKCDIIRAAKSSKNNSEQVRDYQKKWRKDNIEYNKTRRKEWGSQNKEKEKTYRLTNRENIRKHKRKFLEKSRRELTDHYIKTLLTKEGTLGFNDIPDEIIDIKRKQVALKRKIKELKNNDETLQKLQKGV